MTSNASTTDHENKHDDTFASGVIPEEEPITLSWLGRLFAVPLIIVAAIVGCAVLVVLLFGGIASEAERPIGELLDMVERPIGEKTAGMLMPRDKEIWQATRELAMRLTRPEQELSGQDVSSVVSRLVSAVQSDARSLLGQGDGEVRTMAEQKLGFLMAALARTHQPEGIGTIVEQLDHPNPDVRRDAMTALSYYSDPTQLMPYIDRIISATRDDSTEVRIVTSVVLGIIGSAREDARISDALAGAVNDPRAEVQWNAALALARMGEPAGRLVMLDLLDRDFWERQVNYRPDGTVSPQSGGTPLDAGRINLYLKEAIKAGANLDDADVQAAIERLKQDPDPSVRASALKALE